jgi:hypothetical protein
MEDKCRFMGQKVKEVELEKDLLLAERNNAIEANDMSAH